MLALAADNFVPLSPIPGLTDEEYTNLPQYLNAVFNTVIAVAASLAVIMIMFHGIQYSLQEAITEKKDHLVGIRAAVFGLILLLLSWLILFVINPQILDLNALKSSLGGAPSTTVGPPQNTNPAAPGGPPPFESPEGSGTPCRVPWDGC